MNDRFLNYQEFPIKKQYKTHEDELLGDFYLPLLGSAVKYDRISGFFSSTILSIAAEGFSGLIQNDGKMRLIISQYISVDDLKVMKDVFDGRYIEDQRLSSSYTMKEVFLQDRLSTLAWMLKHRKLEIKIAILPNSKAMLHEKIGILRDRYGNAISFSGSNNESTYGWVENIEEFKTFRNWINEERSYFYKDCDSFERLWCFQDKDPNKLRVIDLSKAIREHLIDTSEKYFTLDGDSFVQYQMKHPFTIQIKEDKKEKLVLREYQRDAVKKWISNGHQLLLQMATGTGKTRTAFGCIQEALRVNKGKKILIIIATPQTMLTRQWITDMSKFELGIKNFLECDGDVKEWDKLLKKALRDLRIIPLDMGGNLVIFTTHATASNDKFIELIKQYAGRFLSFFIGDEVHGLGASKSRNALLSDYRYRLGLSATPERWFDDTGSEILKMYFGNDSYQFTLHDALLSGYLVEFEYYPIFVSLTDEEMEKYEKLSKSIAKLANADTDKWQEVKKRMLMQRAKITKNAQNKYVALKHILDQLEAKMVSKGGRIKNTIIFTSDQQIKTVMKILGDRHIIARSVTQHDSQRESKEYGGLSERQNIIEHFKSGDYQVLVAIKCMDEGIDIPSASYGIIMSSSTNPREYIQRIGRIIRRAKNKHEAVIYDMVVEANIDFFEDKGMRKLEKEIYQKELVRVEALSEEAKNSIYVLDSVISHKERG